MKRIAIRILLGALVFGQWSFGQVPPIINYQGRLLNGTNLVNGSVGLSLRLYDSSSGGTLLYEDSNSVSVVDGLYSTFIGDNTSFGSIADALTNAMVYIETIVNGTVLSPRERVVAVPYATAAQTVRGTNLFVSPSSGFVGIGTTAPAARLHVAGSVAVAVVNVSSNYTLTSNDCVVIVSSNATITLPVATTGTVGRIYSVWNGGTGLVFVRPNGTDSLDSRAGTGLQLVRDEAVTIIGEGATGWRSGN